MNNFKNKKMLIVLSIFMILIIMGTASATDENNNINQTISTPNDIENMNTVSTTIDTVDEQSSTAENNNNNLGSNDANEKNNQDNLLKATNNEESLKDDNSHNFNELNILIKSSEDELILDYDYKFDQSTDADYQTYGITINKPIIINGNNHTIDASGNYLFTINADNVVLKNIKLTNFRNAYWNGDNSTMTNVEINNATGKFSVASPSTFNGDTIKVTHSNLFALVYSNVGVVNLNNIQVNFSSNNDQGILYFLGCEFFLNNSKFYNCSRTANPVTWRALCIYSENSFGYMKNLTVENCYYSNHESASSLVVCGGGYHEFTDCHFINNKYSGTSASVYYTDYVADFYNCEFKNNTGHSTLLRLGSGNTIHECEFDSNDGGIYVFGSGAKISKSNFTNNTNSLIRGTNGVVSTTISECNFTNNNISKGVAVDLSNLNKTFIYNSNFKNNTGSLAGAIYVGENRAAKIDNTNVYDNNKFVNGTLNNTVIKGLSDFTTQLSITVSNTDELINAINTVDFCGEILLEPGVYDLNMYRVSIPASLKGLGSGVIINNASVYITMPKGKIENIQFNNSQSYFTMRNQGTILNCNFTNSSLSGSLFVNWDQGFMLNISHCKFENIKFTNTNDGRRYFIGSALGAGIVDYPHSYKYNYEFLDFINVTNMYYVFYVQRGMTFNTFNTITMKNCSFNTFLGSSGSFSKCYNLNFINNTMNSISVSQNNGFFDVVNVSGNKNINNLFTVSAKNTFNNVNVFNNANLTRVFNINTHVEVHINNLNVYSQNATNIINSANAASNVMVNVFDINDCNVSSGFINVKSLNGLNFNNVVFSNNIGILGNSQLLRDSTFNMINGSLLISGESVKLINVTFKNCSNGEHGVVFIDSEQVMIEDCNFIGNRAINGSGVYINQSASQIINCKFINNTASEHGGAIFARPLIYYYIDTPTRDAFSGNSPEDIYAEGTVPTYDVIYISSDFNGREENNMSSLVDAFSLINPNGRIISVKYNDTFNISTSNAFSKANVTIIGWHTNVNVKSVISISAYASNFTISNIIFRNSPNSVFCWKGDDGNIINCTFIDNGGLDAVDCLYGAALDIEADNFVVNGSYFINNIVNGVGDVIGGGAIYSNGTGLTIVNSAFDGNRANSGAHILIADDSSKVNIINSTFKNAKASTSGGSGILINGYNVWINGSDFANNVASNGGALYVDSIVGGVYIIKSNFTGNNASGDGGAIYGNVGRFNVSSCNFEFNKARNGGAIYSKSLIVLDGSNFTGNNASVAGGAVYLVNGGTLINVDFTGNFAVNGSGVYLANGNVLFSDVVVSGNSHSGVDADGAGGDVYIGDGASFSIPSDDLFLGDGQTIRLGVWVSDVVYVNNTVGRFGLGTEGDPLGDLGVALSHVSDSGRIIFINNGVAYDLDNVVNVIDNRVTLVGNGVTIRKDGKYLFILERLLCGEEILFKIMSL